MLRTSFIVLFACASICVLGRDSGLTPPERKGVWIIPSQTYPSEPVWGFANGIRIGLPHSRPQGILRVYHPAITLWEYAAINYIAVEPIVSEARAFSELEPSALDRKQGKRMWSGNTENFEPSDPTQPATGVIDGAEGHQRLSFFVMVEPFENGARTHLRLTFREENPDEVQIESFASPGSEPIKHLVVTATMGNYGRLRQLHFEDKVISSRELWPDFQGNGFAPERFFPCRNAWHDALGDVVVAATSDETSPSATPARGGWNYFGLPSTQYWRVPLNRVSDASVRVNGRVTYYGVHTPIPGGVAYENFDILTPFVQGEVTCFGVTTRTVSELLPPRILREDARKNLTGTMFCDRFSSTTVAAREDAVLTEVLAQRSMPHHLLQSVAVNCSKTTATTDHEAIIFVSPDYFAVGSDDDFLRLPLTPGCAQKIADELKCVMPTRKMVNDIWRSAECKLQPQPIPPSPVMATVPVFCEHNRMVQEQVTTSGATKGCLLAGHKKDVVLTPRLSTTPPPPRVAIYGWHRLDGNPIQPLTLVHKSTYADYSHGLRLVMDRMLLDGQTTSVRAILADPDLCGLLSDEGPVVERY